MDNNKIAPFYIGQEVLGSDRIPPTSLLKKGHDYIISHCRLSINPSNGLGPFWYVGVVGHHNWLAPYLFVPKQTFQSITIKNVLELETPLISVN